MSKAEELLKKLERSITTVNPDMDGNHRYALSHKPHKILTEIKAHLADPKPQRQYRKYEFCKDINCRDFKDNKCKTGLCGCMAKRFHRWLSANDFEIRKKE